MQARLKLDIIVSIGEYFRRVPLVVGEVRHEPWDPMGPYILRAHAALLLLGVSFSAIPTQRETTHREREADKTKMKLSICALFHTLIVLTSAYPGLLRVPKVYNAVITSNQNLSPSRAFPVIQPVIHRTAIGYVPPFYYAQIAPHFSGPEVIHLPEGSRGSTETKPDESSAAASTETRSEDRSKDNQEDAKEDRNDKETGADNSKKKNEDVPLSFYPNYHSLYYDPYFYTYNTFEPHPIPGTYYVDYQPYGPLAPIPATPPKDAERLLPGYHDEGKKETKSETKEKIPDVPPPPLPTAVPKST